MRLGRSIAASVCLLACAALADAWCHSSDVRTVDRVAQPLPRTGINLLTGQEQGLREADVGGAAMCGWFRVVPAVQPTNAILLSRGWYITNMVAVEVLDTTNKTAWCIEHGITPP